MGTNEQTPVAAEPNVVALRQAAEEPTPTIALRHRWWPWLLAVTLVAGAAYGLRARSAQRQPPAAAAGARPFMHSAPVVAATVRQGDMPVYLTGLGSVTAFNTVTVKSRVDGQLIKVAFREGQFVHEGDLLAEIDPRPFQVQLTQAEGQFARDAAQLKEAKINLTRYRDLLANDLIAKQQVDDQASTVGQYEGAVKVDQGAIDNAKLQLTYAHITAPINGRVGLRLVDVGNMVHANDTNGLVVITQVQPIAVIFTLPEDNLPAILPKLHGSNALPVEAYDRSGRTRLATGSLLTVDNQIDQSTGTTRLKAIFENKDNALFPNQFVNVKLLLDVRSEAIIVPAAAIQRGPQGTYVYIVKPDQTVDVRPVTVGPASGGDASIDTGLSAGETVVVDGVDKLRAGSKVEVRTTSSDAAEKPGA
jgi:multidrug efflux system membrane fusion protein